MPWCLISTARLAPKDEMKLLVAAYSAVKGDAMAAAALEVKTMHPLSFFATWYDQGMLSQENPGPDDCGIKANSGTRLVRPSSGGGQKRLQRKGCSGIL